MRFVPVKSAEQQAALAARLAAGEAPEVPSLAQRIVVGLARQIGDLQDRLTAIERELLAWHRSNELSQRLATIPGIGVISATALHRTRDLLVKQRTQLVNMMRGLLAEFGIEMARGLHHALALAAGCLGD